MTAEEFAIGIDMGGTNVKSCVVTPAGRVLAEDHFETADDQAASWAARIKSLLEQLQAKHGRTAWIGVASPGLAARDGRTIAWMQGRLASVQGFDWTKHLGRTELVPVLNDAHAAVMGETWLGGAARARDAVLPTLGPLELRAIKPSNVQQWLRTLENLAATYQRVIYSSLNAILTAAVDDELIARNPCKARSGRRPALPARKDIP